MKNIYDIIDMIRERPAMYLGDKKLSTCRDFLNGVQIATGINGIVEQPRFIDFHSWVSDRFKLECSAQGYVEIIIEKCNGNEEEAFEMFLTLIEEFKKNFEDA